MTLTLEQFEAGYREFQAALNRRDLDAAFATVAPDCEFRTIKELLGERVLVGREQIRRFWEDAFDLTPDWSADPTRFLQAREGVFVVLEHGKGTGRKSEAPVELKYATVVEMRGTTVARVHQYSTWEQGLRAAGLDPSAAIEFREPQP